MKIPFVDLGSQFRELQTELINVFSEIGESGIYVLGEKLKSFEKKIAAYCDVTNAIGVANGSDALFLILKALNIKENDEVIVPTNSFIASAWVVKALGANLKFVDIDDTMNIDTSKIEEAINKKTKAIMPVHLAGRPSDMDEINKIAQKFNIQVIEDAAQAIGAIYKNRKIGSLGKAAGFSMHPLKNLSVYGDGGFVTTNDSNLADKIRLLRNHGLANRNDCVVWGYNSRLDEMQAAFAEIKLQHLDKWNSQNNKIAEFYNKELKNFVHVPNLNDYEVSVFHNYIIRLENRDNLIDYLNSKGIQTRIHYPTPIHLQSVCKDSGYLEGDFPISEKYAKQILSLPIYPSLGEAEISYIVSSIKSFFAK
tara:strand:- start:248 stop:1345 length:1098 start_codon:yes stop_codon:yes gene_type:complete